MGYLVALFFIGWAWLFFAQSVWWVLGPITVVLGFSLVVLLWWIIVEPVMMFWIKRKNG